MLVSNWTSTLDIFESVCNTLGFRYLRLDGQTPVAKRQPLVDRFNSKYVGGGGGGGGGEEQETVFLLSSKAGGVGLNLIGGSLDSLKLCAYLPELYRDTHSNLCAFFFTFEKKDRAHEEGRGGAEEEGVKEGEERGEGGERGSKEEKEGVGGERGG